MGLMLMQSWEQEQEEQEQGLEETHLHQVLPLLLPLLHQVLPRLHQVLPHRKKTNP